MRECRLGELIRLDPGESARLTDRDLEVRLEALITCEGATEAHLVVSTPRPDEPTQTDWACQSIRQRSREAPVASLTARWRGTDLVARGYKLTWIALADGGIGLRARAAGPAEADTPGSRPAQDDLDWNRAPAWYLHLQTPIRLGAGERCEFGNELEVRIHAVRAAGTGPRGSVRVEALRPGSGRRLLQRDVAVVRAPAREPCWLELEQGLRLCLSQIDEEQHVELTLEPLDVGFELGQGFLLYEHQSGQLRDGDLRVTLVRTFRHTVRYDEYPESLEWTELTLRVERGGQSTTAETSNHLEAFGYSIDCSYLVDEGRTLVTVRPLSAGARGSESPSPLPRSASIPPPPPPASPAPEPASPPVPEPALAPAPPARRQPLRRPLASTVSKATPLVLGEPVRLGRGEVGRFDNGFELRVAAIGPPPSGTVTEGTHGLAVVEIWSGVQRRFRHEVLLPLAPRREDRPLRARGAGCRLLARQIDGDRVEFLLLANELVFRLDRPFSLSAGTRARLAEGELQLELVSLRRFRDGSGEIGETENVELELVVSRGGSSERVSRTLQRHRYTSAGEASDEALECHLLVLGHRLECSVDGATLRCRVSTG